MQGQTTASVHVRLPEYLHDDACRLALKQGVSVSALLREGLLKLLKDQHGACLWL